MPKFNKISISNTYGNNHSHTIFTIFLKTYISINYSTLWLGYFAKNRIKIAFNQSCEMQKRLATLNILAFVASQCIKCINSSHFLLVRRFSNKFLRNKFLLDLTNCYFTAATLYIALLSILFSYISASLFEFCEIIKL